MSRSLILSYHYMHSLPFSWTPISLFFVALGILSIFSTVTFLCASEKSKKISHTKNEEINVFSQSRDNTKKLVARLSSSISSKALAMTKMISWRKVEAEDTDDDQSDDAVWRKSIMMGERCRPLDFSGKIVYDSQGNLLSDFSNWSSYQSNVSFRYLFDKNEKFCFLLTLFLSCYLCVTHINMYINCWFGSFYYYRYFLSILFYFWHILN